MTISDDTFDLTKQGYPYQPCPHQTRDVGTPWPLPLSRHGSWQAPSPCFPANDIWWTSLETGSNLFIWPQWIASSHTHCCSTQIWWPPKHVQLASGWYTSYLNAYLFNDIHFFLVSSDGYLIHSKIRIFLNDQPWPTCTSPSQLRRTILLIWQEII